MKISNYDDTKTKILLPEQVISIFKAIAASQIKLDNIRKEILPFLKPLDVKKEILKLFQNLTSSTGVSYQDLEMFCKKSSIFSNPDTMKKLVAVYDIDDDGILNYEEFSSILRGISNENEKSSIEKTAYFNYKNFLIDADLMYVLVKILITELEFWEHLKTLNESLVETDRSFHPRKLFNSICCDKNDIITPIYLESFIENFILKNYKVFSQRILNRMDPGKKGAISFSQFEKFFTIACSSSFSTSSTSQSNGFNSKKSPFQGTMRELPRYALGSNKCENEMFTHFLMFILDREQNIEKMKQNLLNQLDFNIAHIYNSITKDLISMKDFKQYVNTKFNFYPTEDELNLIFRRYSNKGKLNFLAFCRILSKKTSISFSQRSYDYLSEETSNQISDLLKEFFQNESEIEVYRSKLNKMSLFNIKDIFYLLSEGKEYITPDDWSVFLNVTDNLGVEILMRRFDKNEDGKVTYDEVRK